MVVPYSKVLNESFKNVCTKAGVQDHFKGGNTIGSSFSSPKYKDNIIGKGGVIHRYKCDHPEYNRGMH